MPTNEAEMVNLAYLTAHGPITPLNYKEAIQCPQSAEWNKAMEEEFDNHTHRKTWELVPLPKDLKTIGSRWTYIIKLGPDGTVSRYKARLVAQGFSQAIGIDYNDMFAPTVRLEMLRALFHLTVAYGWSHGQDDVVTAFLHGDLDETIYMHQPEGYDDGTGRVARLLRSIYGLKQAARIWNKLMHQKLITVGYDQLTSDTAVYLCNHNDDITILAIYVDNVMSFGNTKPGLSKS